MGGTAGWATAGWSAGLGRGQGQGGVAPGGEVQRASGAPNHQCQARVAGVAVRVAAAASAAVSLPVTVEGGEGRWGHRQRMGGRVGSRPHGLGLPPG